MTELGGELLANLLRGEPRPKTRAIEGLGDR
jgi:hypothetical protein